MAQALPRLLVPAALFVGWRFGLQEEGGCRQLEGSHPSGRRRGGLGGRCGCGTGRRPASRAARPGRWPGCGARRGRWAPLGRRRMPEASASPRCRRVEGRRPAQPNFRCGGAARCAAETAWPGWRRNETRPSPPQTRPMQWRRGAGASVRLNRKRDRQLFRRLGCRVGCTAKQSGLRPVCRSLGVDFAPGRRGIPSTTRRRSVGQRRGAVPADALRMARAEVQGRSANELMNGQGAVFHVEVALLIRLTASTVAGALGVGTGLGAPLWIRWPPGRRRGGCNPLAEHVEQGAGHGQQFEGNRRAGARRGLRGGHGSGNLGCGCSSALRSGGFCFVVDGGRIEGRAAGSDSRAVGSPGCSTSTSASELGPHCKISLWRHGTFRGGPMGGGEVPKNVGSIFRTARARRRCTALHRVHLGADRSESARSTTSRSSALSVWCMAWRSVGREKIRVNAVCPGPTDTPMLRMSSAPPTASRSGRRRSRWCEAGGQVPMGRPRTTGGVRQRRAVPDLGRGV